MSYYEKYMQSRLCIKSSLKSIRKKTTTPKRKSYTEYKQSSQKGMLMFFKLWKKKKSHFWKEGKWNYWKVLFFAYQIIKTINFDSTHCVSDSGKTGSPNAAAKNFH